jgi:hypothetical protein
VRSLRGRIVKVTDTQLLSDEDDVRLLENGSAQSFQFADDAQVAPPLMSLVDPLDPLNAQGGLAFSLAAFSLAAHRNQRLQLRACRVYVAVIQSLDDPFKLLAEPLRSTTPRRSPTTH